ncbi:MAG TPA: hypothetical protein RMG48_14040 [Myxococcales bacterium LLY-WYZ-16_1]|nr:hypothetical protein [Myxococcales bacterium LLY-WYZ-16_1]
MTGGARDAAAGDAARGDRDAAVDAGDDGDLGRTDDAAETGGSDVGPDADADAGGGDGGRDDMGPDMGGCVPRLPGTMRVNAEQSIHGRRMCDEVCAGRGACCIGDFSWPETGEIGGGLATYGAFEVNLDCDQVPEASRQVPSGLEPLADVFCGCR